MSERIDCTDPERLAEGIETEDQLGKLRGLGCDVGRGYLFSRPVPAVQLRELL